MAMEIVKNATGIEIMKFSTQELITVARSDRDEWARAVEACPHAVKYQQWLQIADIALAVLTAPRNIPPQVLDSMSDMCDGGFDAQGIWDLCKSSIMPPEPCPRCRTVSSRPNGEHYCHAGEE
ncbi:hypothetical protein ABXQ62_003591 [Escherichia coli]